LLHEFLLVLLLLFFIALSGVLWDRLLFLGSLLLFFLLLSFGGLHMLFGYFFLYGLLYNGFFCRFLPRVPGNFHVCRRRGHCLGMSRLGTRGLTWRGARLCFGRGHLLGLWHCARFVLPPDPSRLGPYRWGKCSSLDGHLSRGVL
jgi:hypothetical protein